MSRDYHNAAAAEQQARSLQADREQSDMLKSFLLQRRQNEANTQQQQTAGEQQTALKSQEGEQAQSLARLKDQMGAEGTQRNAQSLQDLLKGAAAGAGGSIGENGNVSLTKAPPDPYAKAQVAADARNQKLDSDWSKMAQNQYNKGADKRLDQMSKFNKIMDNLNDPNAISGGLAKTEIIGALGMNRYNQQEASAIYGPSASGLFAQVQNAMGGNEGTLSPAQVAATRQAVVGMYGAAKQAHDTAKGSALDTYKSAPTFNPTTAARLQGSIGGSFDKAAQDFEDRYVPKSQGQPNPQAAGAQAAPKYKNDADELTQRLAAKQAQQNKGIGTLLGSPGANPQQTGPQNASTMPKQPWEGQ